MIHNMKGNIAGDKDLAYISNKIGMFRVGINYVACTQYQIPFVYLSFIVMFYIL
uniref:Uncharacterized protein n=1 Tax=Lepeophtheirus salmonis TaxID=72036 RepID=A0A0K2SXI4_LEPSM